MKYLCYHCGGRKFAPTVVCPACGRMPRTAAEKSLAQALNADTYPAATMQTISHALKTHQWAGVPEEIVAIVRQIRADQSARVAADKAECEALAEQARWDAQATQRRRTPGLVWMLMIGPPATALGGWLLFSVRPLDGRNLAMGIGMLVVGLLCLHGVGYKLHLWWTTGRPDNSTATDWLLSSLMCRLKRSLNPGKKPPV